MIICERCEIEANRSPEFDKSGWECFICPKCDGKIFIVDTPLDKMRKYENNITSD